LAIAHWPPAAKRAAARSDWLLVGAIVVYLLANLPFLVVWPAVNGDEGREANAFWVASSVDPSAQTLDPVFRHDPLYKGGLQGLTTGISFRLFGLGLYQGRLVSLVWGGLLLWATFLAGRRLYGPAAGAVAVLLLAVLRGIGMQQASPAGPVVDDSLATQVAGVLRHGLVAGR
jgi:predicted membrane-bound mannosyltransferase